MGTEAREKFRCRIVPQSINESIISREIREYDGTDRVHEYGVARGSKKRGSGGEVQQLERLGEGKG